MPHAFADAAGLVTLALIAALAWHLLGRLARHWRVPGPMALGTLICLGWLLS